MNLFSTKEITLESDLCCTSYVSMFLLALIIVSSAGSKLHDITKPVRSTSYGIVNLVCCELVIFLKLHLWQLTFGILWQAPLTKVYSWARWCRQLQSNHHDVTNQAALCENRQPRDSIHNQLMWPKNQTGRRKFPSAPNQPGWACLFPLNTARKRERSWLSIEVASNTWATPSSWNTFTRVQSRWEDF